jgi:rhodanese-related sulfurtransferase
VAVRVAFIAALFAGGTACSPGGPAVGGARSFVEIDVPAAARSLERDQARLVQVRDPEFADPRVEAATMLGPGESVPDAWLAQARPILVIGHDEAAARRLAARLLRLGAARVSVVRGGIGPWSRSQEEDPDAASPTARVGLSNAVDAKPLQREPARRIDPWQQSQK